MGKVISFVNQKGGVAKTTSADIMAYILANDYGKKVLIIDFDGQGNTSRAMGILDELNANIKEDEAPILLDDIENTISDIMNSIIKDDVIPLADKYTHHLKGVDLIPANSELSMLENNLVNVEFQREMILKRFIDTIKDRYDYIIIDGLPKLGLQMINILYATDEVIIPTHCAKKSLDGFHDLIKTINLVKKYGHNDLKIAGILITMANENTSAFKVIKEDIEKNFSQYNIFTPVIPYCKKFEEGDVVGELWVEREPKHKTSLKYKEFVAEYLKGE